MNLNAGIIECGGIKYKMVDIRPFGKTSLFFEGDKISIGIDTVSLEVVDVQIPVGYGMGIISKLSNDHLVSEVYGDKFSTNLYEYYFNNKRHRKDKPALECGKFYMYYRHGVLHRMDGPTHLTEKGWEYNVNGKSLPDDLPRFLDGKLIGELTKSKVIEAMQFDREYGLFLRKKLREDG